MQLIEGWTTTRIYENKTDKTAYVKVSTNSGNVDKAFISTDYDVLKEIEAASPTNVGGSVYMISVYESIIVKIPKGKSLYALTLAAGVTLGVNEIDEHGGISL